MSKCNPDFFLEGFFLVRYAIPILWLRWPRVCVFGISSTMPLNQIAHVEWFSGRPIFMYKIYSNKWFCNDERLRAKWSQNNARMIRRLFVGMKDGIRLGEDSVRAKKIWKNAKSSITWLISVKVVDIFRWKNIFPRLHRLGRLQTMLCWPIYLTWKIFLSQMNTNSSWRQTKLEHAWPGVVLLVWGLRKTYFPGLTLPWLKNSLKYHRDRSTLDSIWMVR